MSGRFGHYVAALGGLAIATAALAQQPDNRARGQDLPQARLEVPADDAQLAAAAAIAKAAQAFVRDAAPSNEDQVKAAEDRQRDKDQLEADQSAALWAMVAALAALSQIPLSAFGIWLVWGTLKATKAAVEEAGDATDAAQAAVDVTEKTAHLQLRPYVYITSEHVGATISRPDITKGVSIKLPRDVGSIEFSFKNFGQTPAKRVRIRARCFVGGYWNVPFRSNFGSAVWIYVGDMPPGFEKNIDAYTVTNLASQYAAVKDAVKSIILDGQIEYWDAAGAKYTTKFRRACTGDDVERGTFFVTPKGNEAM